MGSITVNGTIIAGRQEYLVSYSKEMMGKAMRALIDLGVRREIRLYPKRKMLLLDEELDNLRKVGVKEQEAILLT